MKIQFHFSTQLSSFFTLPILALSAMLCTPTTATAQSQSILLSSGNFAVLGGTAVTSSGSVGTSINGNVGSSVSVTGFPPGVITVNGVPATPIVANAVTTQAETDLITAANGLAAMTPTMNLTGTDLGGLTLLPGVYKFNVAANQVLSSILTLDANHQNNVSWVFQIGSSLVMGANDQIQIINPGTNASSDGIFFDAETGGITFGANDQILGNFLAATSITYGAGVSGSGRGLAQAGVALDTDVTNSTGGNGNGFSSGLMYNGTGQVVPSAIPEPATYVWIVSLGAMGFACWKQKSRKKIFA